MFAEEMLEDAKRLRDNKRMVLQVQKIGNEFAVVFPPQIAEELGLADGDSLEIRKAEPTVRYASAEEVLRAFDKTLPRHEAAYIELAK